MCSKWKVTSQYFDNSNVFAVYRLKNAADIDHSGNREFATGYITDRQEAEKIAEKLNQNAQKEVNTMFLNNRSKTITPEQEKKAREIAALAREIPEREQEKILYMMKGIAIMSPTAEKRAAGV